MLPYIFLTFPPLRPLISSAISVEADLWNLANGSGWEGRKTNTSLYLLLLDSNRLLDSCWCCCIKQDRKRQCHSWPSSTFEFLRLRFHRLVRACAPLIAFCDPLFPPCSCLRSAHYLAPLVVRPVSLNSHFSRLKYSLKISKCMKAHLWIYIKHAFRL